MGYLFYIYIDICRESYRRGEINDSKHNAIGILRSVSNTLSNSVNGEFEGI